MSSQIYGLLLHNDYNTTYCAIAHKNSIVAYEALANRQAASYLIPRVSTILNTTNRKLHDCRYIAVNRGPTPFTTLRTIISTANGLSYATSTPLIGIDGIQAIAEHTDAPDCSHVLVLLHAFRNDVYYGLYDQQNHAIMYGWNSFDTFYTDLDMFAQSQRFFPRIYCVGNGVQNHYIALKNASNYEAVIDHPITSYADIEHIADIAYKQWQNNKTTQMLTPLYLKKAQAYLHQ